MKNIAFALLFAALLGSPFRASAEALTQRVTPERDLVYRDSRPKVIVQVEFKGGDRGEVARTSPDICCEDGLAELTIPEYLFPIAAGFLPNASLKPRNQRA